MVEQVGVDLDAALAEDDAPGQGAGEIIRWVLRRQRRTIVLGATAGITWMAAIALLPVLLGRAIDHAVAGGSSVLTWSGVVAGIVAVEAGAAVVRHRTAMLLYVRTRWLVERLVTRRVLDPRGGGGGDAGDLLASAQGDARAVADIADLMCRGSGAVVTFVGVGIGMLVSVPSLGIAVLAGVPLALLALVPLWRPYDRRATAQQASLAAATAVAADAVAGLRVVHGVGGQDAVQRWFRAASDDARDTAVAFARISSAWNALSTTIPGVVLSVVLWIAGRRAVDGDLEPGQLVAFAGLAVFLALPVMTLAEVGEVWASGLAGARRIAAILADPAAIQDAGTTLITPSTAHAIRLCEVTHGPLQGFDLEIDRGELLGIACADRRDAGALIDLVARRADPAEGQVLLDGIDIRTLGLAQLRHAVLVDDGHRPWLLDAPLAANLCLRDDPVGAEDLQAALLAAAGEDLLARSPDLTDGVGDRGLALSGGQRQRVVVARAIVADAPVLVLDDPTGAQDTITESRLLERLVEVRRGRTTVLLTTSAAALAVCDRVALVVDGEVVARGPHAELLASDRYRRLVIAGVG